MLADLGPDGKKRALSLVVACTICVGFAKITDDNRTVDSADDRTQRDLLGRSSEYVASANTAFRGDDSSTFEGKEDLLEVGLGQASTLGNVAHRGRSRVSLAQG